MLSVFQVLEEAKQILLRCATPESLVRLPKTALRAQASTLMKQYFDQLKQNSIEQYLMKELRDRAKQDSKMIMVYCLHSPNRNTWI